jgi:hypothetical protein
MRLYLSNFFYGEEEILFEGMIEAKIVQCT